MKRYPIISLLLLFIVSATFAQVPMDENSGKFIYKEVVQEEGTQPEFFIRAVNWVNITYKNSASVTSVRDPHTGLIEGNHRFRLSYTNADGVKTDGEMILYHFKLQFKEGRYRYTFDEFEVKKQSHFPMERWADPEDPDYRSDLTQVLNKVNDNISVLIESLKETMKPPVVVEEEEW